MGEQLNQCFFCGRWVDYDIYCVSKGEQRQCCDNCAAQWGEDDESVAYQEYLAESQAEAAEHEMTDEEYRDDMASHGAL